GKCVLCVAVARLAGKRARAAFSDRRFVREAAHYKKLDHKRIECRLCPRHCQVADQETGWCGVRTNDGGTYYTEVFGRPVTIHNDPIEKKPLFHFKPGSLALSLSTAGCNFECQFCQNWEISQFRPEQVPARYGFVPPEALVDAAKRRGSASIAFTYGEPVVFFEYMLATARVSKAEGVPGVMISNGYIEPEPMKQLCEVLGAVKVDFKAYSEDFYKKWCRGKLKPVLETMKLVKRRGVWLEMVHLTIPTLNDDEEQTKRLCGWVLENLGPDVPLHFTRFHPTYKLNNLPPTPVSTLERQYRIAKDAGIHFPYVGNVPGHEGENTYCPSCGKLLIKRVGFSVLRNEVESGKCPGCNGKIPGIW
ncbi:MAG: AmmeMemoRadiSam system radical SAM enzyme, partial [Deltaproteobacteria bacterium]